MSGQKLTEADKDALAQMPGGWFSAADLPHMIRCPMARCKRLEERGELEKRVVGSGPFLFSEFRKRSV